jgi:hypothetical protein
MSLGDRLARLEDEAGRQRFDTPEARERIVAALRRQAAGRRVSIADRELAADRFAWCRDHPDTPNLLAELTTEELLAQAGRLARKLPRKDETRRQFEALALGFRTGPPDTIHPWRGPGETP